MNKDVYPQEVDFNYTVRCSKHNFKPYEYCEICMLRSKIQNLTEENARKINAAISSLYINQKDTYDLLIKLRKQIDEMAIEINLLKEKKQ